MEPRRSSVGVTRQEIPKASHGGLGDGSTDERGPCLSRPRDQAGGMPGAADDVEAIYEAFEVTKARPVVDVERLKNKRDRKAASAKPREYFDEAASISVQ
jgi:hypothetical protein